LLAGLPKRQIAGSFARPACWLEELKPASELAERQSGSELPQSKGEIMRDWETRDVHLNSYFFSDFLALSPTKLLDSLNHPAYEL